MGEKIGSGLQRNFLEGRTCSVFIVGKKFLIPASSRDRGQRRRIAWFYTLLTKMDHKSGP
jgi:hypothetical protein